MSNFSKDEPGRVEEYFSAFSLTGVYVLDGTTSFSSATEANSLPIRGVRSVSFGNLEREGPLGLTLHSGYLSLSTWATLVGGTYTRDTEVGYDPWTSSTRANSDKRYPMVITLRGKNKCKEECTIRVGFYSCEFTAPCLTAITYREVATSTLQVQAYSSLVSETGDILPEPSLSRIIASA